MEKNSVLYQLMYVRMNSIMNKIVMADEEYREITRKADIALEKIEALHLPPETMQLIDRYVSEPLLYGGKKDHGKGADAPFRGLPAAKGIRVHQFMEQRFL